MPAGSAVAEVEKDLKEQYPNNPGAVYGTLNKIGLMHGNKPTKKGLRPAHHNEGGLAHNNQQGQGPRAFRCTS